MKTGFGPGFEMHFHVRQSKGSQRLCQKQSIRSIEWSLGSSDSLSVIGCSRTRVA